MPKEKTRTRKCSDCGERWAQEQGRCRRCQHAREGRSMVDVYRARTTAATASRMAATAHEPKQRGGAQINRCLDNRAAQLARERAENAPVPPVHQTILTFSPHVPGSIAYQLLGGIVRGSAHVHARTAYGEAVE